MVIIDGKKMAGKILANVARKVQQQPMTLAIVQVGHRPDSDIYIRQKIRAASRAGIQTQQIHCQARASQASVIKVLQRLAVDPKVHGILLQLPLPSHLDTQQIIAAIPPEKDVDGFTSAALVVSPLIQAIEASLRASKKTSGQILILGRTSIFTHALEQRLYEHGFRVTIAPGLTSVPTMSTKADIIISVRGRGPKILPKHLKKGAVVLDAGIRRYEQSVGGDADPSIATVVSAYTPVPGGIGPLTVAYAIANTVALAQKNTARPKSRR